MQYIKMFANIHNLLAQNFHLEFYTSNNLVGFCRLKNNYRLGNQTSHSDDAKIR